MRPTGPPGGLTNSWPEMTRPELSLCSRCGRCLSVCPTYRETALETHSPRGRLFLLSRGLKDHPAIKSCLRCGSCETVCPNRIPLAENLCLEPPGFPQIPPLIWEKILTGFLSPEKRDPPSAGEPLILLSCGATKLYPGAVKKLKIYLKNLGFNPAETLPLCCGLPLLSLEQKRAFLRVAEKNLLYLTKTKGPLVTLCASCLWTLRRLYPLLFRDTELEYFSKDLSLRIYEIGQFLSFIKERVFLPAEVGFHVPCHLRGEALGVSGARVEACCGSAQPKSLWQKEMPFFLREKLLKGQALRALATACTGCYLKLKRTLKAPPEVKHWVEFLGV